MLLRTLLFLYFSIIPLSIAVEGGKVFENGDPKILKNTIKIKLKKSFLSKSGSGSGVFIKEDKVLTAAHIFVHQSNFGVTQYDKKHVKRYFKRKYKRKVKKVIFQPKYIDAISKASSLQWDLYQKTVTAAVWKEEVENMTVYDPVKIAKYEKAVSEYIEVNNHIYDAMVDSVQYDLALIELEPRNKPKKEKNYPEIPDSDYKINDGDTMFLTGFGGTGHVMKSEGNELDKSMGLTWGTWEYEGNGGFLASDKAIDQYNLGNILYHETKRSREVFNVAGYRAVSDVNFFNNAGIMSGDSGGGVYHKDIEGNFTLVGINSSSSEFRNPELYVGIFDEDKKLGPFKLLSNDFSFSLGNWADEKVPNSYTYLLNFIHPESLNIAALGLSNLYYLESGLYRIKDFTRYLRRLDYFNTNIYVDLRSKISQEFLHKHLK
ncbi:trypsin-like serine protease [Bacteriovoracaceae bacterium]|nr:trypsin-like serine protease [Bacteriovoracaceae bacterium]